MASRAVRVTIDWSKFASEINPKNRPGLAKLKGKCDANAVKVASLPESLPKIDWAFYKANASDPKIVDEIQKAYSSLKVEAPKAPASRMADLDRAKEQDLARFKKFVEVAKSYAESAEIVKQKFENMIPVHEMTSEDWCRTFPYWSPSIDNPSVDRHGRVPGLSRAEQIAFEQPDPVPYATPTAWKDWEVRKAKFYT